jgi:hypothetical protein
MSSMLKCPNPSCPYVFDPSQVPTGVVLSCPRCGMQFTLGAPAAPPPPQPAAPYAGDSAPTATLPGAAQQAAQQSTQRAQQAAAGASAVQKRERPVAARSPGGAKGGNKAQVILLSIIASALIAGTALTIYFKFTGTKSTGTGGAVVRPDGIDLRFEEPAGWSEDPDTKVKVGSVFHFAYRRENPEAYMLFGSRKPEGNRPPRPTQMAQDLRVPFPKLFDLSTVREEAASDPKWLGLAPGPNHSFRFRAQSQGDEGLVWLGESYAVLNKGIAYYWVSWCKESDFDALKGEFAEFRGKFAFMGNRQWKESNTNVIAFKGDQVPYTLSDSEGVWKEISASDLEAEKANDKQPLDKVLRAKVMPNRDRKAITADAELRVYILDGAGEPQERAKELVHALETARLKETDLVPAFTDLTEPPQGDPVPDVPGLHSSTPVARVLSTVKESKDSSRVLVASGYKVGEKIVVVVCYCKAGVRVLFETKFVQIASSLR